ncbi:Os03g0338200, partial [Oryza sativa Japonica Group]
AVRTFFSGRGVQSRRRPSALLISSGNARPPQAPPAVSPNRTHAVPLSLEECLVVWDNKLNWIRQGHQFPPRRSCGAVDTVERLFHLRCPCCHPRPHCISVLDLRLSLTTIQESLPRSEFMFTSYMFQFITTSTK